MGRHAAAAPTAAPKLEALLGALAAEPDPPTTIRAASEALDAHVADSLSGLDIEGLAMARRIADLGSGAGFPGLALAAALPASAVDLIESTERKCAVITRLAESAGIPNATALPVRAEEWAAAGGACAYEAVTARALGPLALLAEYAAPLLAQGGVLVCWKGARDPDEERDGARAAQTLGLKPLGVSRVEPFPGARDRHLHSFMKVDPTPPAFPRRPGMARKRPLG